MVTHCLHAWRSAPLLLIAVVLHSCVADGPRTPQLSGETKDMADSGHTHHAIDYVELAVTDMARSKRFYEAAFDWKFNDYGPDYAGIQKQGGEAGGLRLEPEVRPGGPLVIVYSQDLDASLARVREAGGRITQEPFAFPGGRRFHFEDPSGNELAVWAEE
jgi:predicted enzyme related to lactoylglutathione lyase